MTDKPKLISAASAAPKLTGAQLRHLRALGHPLDAVVMVGKEGLTESLIRATDAALTTHELIKVKMRREAPTDRHEGSIELAARTGSVLAQVIGRTALLYRRNPKKQKITFPVRKASGQSVPKAPRKTEEPEDNS